MASLLGRFITQTIPERQLDHAIHDIVNVINKTDIAKFGEPDDAIRFIDEIGLLAQLVGERQLPIAIQTLHRRFQDVLLTARQDDIAVMRHLADVCVAYPSVFGDSFVLDRMSKLSRDNAKENLWFVPWLKFFKYYNLTKELVHGPLDQALVDLCEWSVMRGKEAVEAAEEASILALDVVLLYIPSLFADIDQDCLEDSRSSEQTLVNAQNCVSALFDYFWDSFRASVNEFGITPPRLKLWIKLLALAAYAQTLCKLSRHDDYWLFIQQGLQTRSTEKRKLCLYILRESLNLHTEDFVTEGTAIPIGIRDYERYCAVYETIVLGCYPNQVEECLKSLPDGCLHGNDTKDGFKVQRSWWLILCTAALTQTQTESVSKMVGNWVLSQRYSVTMPSKDFSEFIAEQLVPWAMQGQYFYRSVVRRGTKVCCEHGDRLAQFLSSLLLNASDSKTRTIFAVAIMEGILKRTPRVNQHAVGFVLQGLDLNNGHSTSLSQETHIYTATEIQVVSHIGENVQTDTGHVVRREKDMSFLALQLINTTLLTPSLKRICRYHVQSIVRATDSMNNSALDLPMDEHMAHLTPSPVILSDAKPFKSLLQEIHSSGYKVLKGNGLVKMISTVASILRNSHTESSPHSISDDIYAIFFAIWEEAEIQDLPRSVLSRIPDIFFDQVPIRTCVDSMELQGFLSERLLQFSKLSRTRIYLWRSLAETLRLSYFQVPDLSHLLPLEEFLFQFASSPPLPTVEFLVDDALSQRIKDAENKLDLVQHADEGLGHACTFDLMNRMREADQPLGRRIIQMLLQPWLSDINLHAQTSRSHWKRLSMFQTMLILSEKCLVEYDSASSFRHDLFIILEAESKPQFRFLLEWMILSTYWRFQNHLYRSSDELLKRLTDAIGNHENISPKVVVSILKIGIKLSQQKNISVAYVTEFSAIISALCAHDKVAIRFEAQWSFIRMMDLAQKQAVWDHISSNAAYKYLDANIRSLAKQKSPRPNQELEHFNPESDQHLGMLFGGGYLQLGDQGNVATSVVTLQDFEAIYKRDAETGTSKPNAHMPLGHSKLQPHQPFQNTVVSSGPEPTGSLPQALQSKSFSLLDKEISHPSLANSKKCEIILVASFVDSPPNLGGLSRVAEIFGCSELHISDISTVKHPAFAKVSVTSETHIRIKQTKVQDLPAMIKQKKFDGWCILGVEQTDSSTVLGDPEAKLPAKAVVIMGAEKTGIPPEILIECDRCVEIKQWGLTRSLNVQTAAGTILYEYRRQWGDGL